MSGHDQFQEVSTQEQDLSRVAHWFVILTSLLLFYYAIDSPSYDWDMLGYSAAAVSLENADVNYVHGYVYGELKEYVTEEQFKILTEGVYRGVMLDDADAFNQQIPFYKIRILVVLLIFTLVKCGVNIFQAIHIISAVFTCTGILFFYFAYKKVIHPIFWVVLPLFIIGFQVINVAQGISADSLAFFWVGLLCFAFMHAYWKAFFLLLAISVMVRTDMIIFVALFTSYFILLRPRLRISAAICAVVSVGIYLAINKFTGNFGWGTVFYYVFVSGMKATHPVEYSSVGVSIGQYMSAVISNSKSFLNKPSVLLFELSAFLQFIIFWLSQKKISPAWNTLINIFKNPVLVLTLLSVGYFLLHYILFPAVWFRFFVGPYMVAGLGLLSIMTALIKKIDRDRGGP